MESVCYNYGLSENQMSPKSDILFKILFGDQNHPEGLISLLNSILQYESPIVSVKIEHTELSPEIVANSTVRLDIVATNDRKEKINIEMQQGKPSDMVARSLFYVSKLYGNQQVENNKYDNLMRTVGINIIDYIHFNEDEEWHHKLVLADDKSHKIITDKIEMHFIEFIKLNTKFTIFYKAVTSIFIYTIKLYVLKVMLIKPLP